MGLNIRQGLKTTKKGESKLQPTFCAMMKCFWNKMKSNKQLARVKKREVLEMCPIMFKKKDKTSFDIQSSLDR